jgi:hypothetical protein
MVPFFQLAIFTVSAAFLATQLESFFKSTWMAGIVLFCLLFNPEAIKYHLTIMTESLSFSLLCLYLAFVARYLETKVLRNIAIAALIAGLAALIRPINYTWLAGVGLLVIIVWRHHPQKLWKLFLLSFVPYGSVIFLGCVIFFFKHGEFKTQSFLGHNLHGKTMFYLDESVPTKAPHYMTYMVKVITPMRKAILTCPSIQCRYSLSAPSYDYIRRSMVKDAGRISAIKADFGPEYVVKDDFYMARALEVLRAKPREFFQDVALQLFSLWAVLEIKTSHERDILREALNGNAALKDKEQILNYTHFYRVVPTPLVYGMRAGLLSVCILSLLLIGVGVFKRVYQGDWAERIRFLAIAGVVIHVGYLGIALIQAGFPRYVLSFWPCMYIYASFMTCYLWSKTFRKWGVSPFLYEALWGSSANRTL